MIVCIHVCVFTFKPKSGFENQALSIVFSVDSLCKGVALSVQMSFLAANQCYEEGLIK